MASVDINELVKGMVQDEAAYQLPPEFWTTARNMRVAGGGSRSLPGWTQVFGTPSGAPHFAIPIVNAAQSFWVYTSLTKAFVYDGSSHNDITRAAGGDYNAGETRNWNGTIIGGLLVLNNGTDVPQYWPTLGGGTDLLPIPNWPVGGKIAVLRSFNNYLVGINYTLAGANYPHMVKWSARVDDPGTIPQSWDETDPTLDAGEYDLPDVNSGILIEARILGSRMFLYKERATWAMRFIGGRAIFSFDTFLETSGILAPRCVASTGDGKRHIVVTQDDIIVHNGISDPESVVSRKMRRTLFNAIDTDAYINSFMYTDPEYDEVVFCYPEHGQTNPTRALVINYRTGALTEMDGVTFRNVASGIVESAGSSTWTSVSGSWSAQVNPWGLQERNQLVACIPDSTKMVKMNDTSFTRDGVSYTSSLQRTGLSLIGRRRSGEWIVNHETFKFCEFVWPKLRGAPVRIRIGCQMVVDGEVAWGPYQDFDPAADIKVDVACSARALAIEFSMQTTQHWQLDGYRLTIHADGQF